MMSVSLFFLNPVQFIFDCEPSLEATIIKRDLSNCPFTPNRPNSEENSHSDTKCITSM